MTAPQNKVIASRLEQARKNKGYSQAELCRLGSFHKASYNNWENGRRSISLEDAKKIGAILGVSAAYILNLTNNPSPINIHTENHKIQTIPLFNSDTLEDSHDNWIPITYIPVNKEYFGIIDENTFGFLVSDNCMNNIAISGDIIFINPCDKPKHGDIVLIKSKPNNLVFLRHYLLTSESIEKKIIELKPTNSSCANITLEDESKILILGVARNRNKIIF